MPRTDAAAAKSPILGAFILGMALSGFFDGILLHQVLQWHHFLSLLPGETMQDIRRQIMADGLFHVAVYVLTIVGLYCLWQRRAALSRPAAEHRITGGVLLGFGVWNLIDVGIFHWILRFHRVRVNVPNPLAYDLAWFVGLGLFVALLGYWVLHRQGSAEPGSGSRGRGVALALVGMLLLSGMISNVPPANASTVILFGRQASISEGAAAIAGAGAQIIFVDPAGGYALAANVQPSAYWSLYRAGAIAITSAPALTGCLAFTRT
ncbi:MAG: DUF2243 domain-containing protein [Sphingobium sp.]|uniref:DUF2243 domain-containing protein n=1 Tax=Sphingobium sp. TaxID=1912891 RepID=UPI0029A7598A|nr:DUF2243 domain-containing protein [Sphingobium sp.]MDX3909944.1 DUF2243 domain-containing protein [Sphingobium sp.]